METQCAKRRIAVAVERSTGFGRNLLRGFAEIAGTRPEWDLSLLDPRRTAAAAAGARRFDAWVCRIPDDRAASALARTRRPVVDLATNHHVVFGRADHAVLPVLVLLAVEWTSRRRELPVLPRRR